MEPDRRLSPEVVRGYSRLCLPRSKQCLGAVETDEETCVESRLTSSVLSEVKSEASKPPISVENETRGSTDLSFSGLRVLELDTDIFCRPLTCNGRNNVGCACSGAEIHTLGREGYQRWLI
jgi:hypothetical protein